MALPRAISLRRAVVVRMATVAALATFVVLNASVSGQTARQSGPGTSRAGVLVGLWDYGLVPEGPTGLRGPVPEATLRTLWIDLRNTERPVRAVVLPHLLVPRRSGFWQLGLQSHCAEEPDEGGLDENGDPDPQAPSRGTMVTITDQLWAVPLGSAPRAEIPEHMGADPRLSSSPCVAADVRCVNDWTATVYWVWPDYASLELGTRGECGAHPDWTPGYTVRAIDDLTSAVRIGDVIGPATEQRLRAEYDKAVAEQASDDRSCAEEASFDPSSWYIERRTLTWIVRGWASTRRLCGYGIDYTTDADLSALMGRTPEARASRLTPEADYRFTTLREGRELDSHVSPDRQWILRRSASELSAGRSVVARQPPVLTLSPSEEIVMVEWATGAHVARWAATVERLRRLSQVRAPSR